MLKIKNSLGQIFLKNKKIIKKIIYYIKPKKKNIFLEIGFGHGELTKKILKFNKKVTSLEIDNFLVKKNQNNNFNLINIDVLKFNLFNFFLKKKKKIRIFGNIPYYISKKILIKLITNYKIIKDIYIMVQKEFYYLLTANKKNKKYSKFSILIQYIYKIKFLMKIKKTNFYPIPKVDSVFIKLIPQKKKNKVINLNHFKHILNNSFKKKNKKIINNLKNIFNKNILNKLNKLNINLHKRPKEISIENFCKITNIYSKYKKNIQK